MKMQSLKSLIPHVSGRLARRLAGATLGLMLCAGVALPGTANAVPTIAYKVAGGLAGFQAHEGNLGMDFDVLQDINVIDLGVFDASSDGLNRTITAQIWNRLTTTVVAQLEFTPTDPGDLIGGSRFKALDNPLLLTAGFQGSIVVYGYGHSDEMFANAVGAAQPWGTVDDGGGLIDFVTGTRYGFDTSAFPTNTDTGPEHGYAAGTFTFEAADSSSGDPDSIPEAATILSFAAGLAAFGLLRRRNRGEAAPKA